MGRKRVSEVKDPGAVSIKDFMSRWVEKDLELCIGCKSCMEACPVSKEPFSIGELNLATQEGTSVPERIVNFAWNCVQCGRCVPVCPAGARRDYMVLSIRHKLLDQRPGAYKRYLAMKGPFVCGSSMVKQKLYSGVQKLAHPGQARYMESTPTEHKALLFYPGCYFYSSPVIKRTLRLLDHVAEPYNVLGGLNSCCGVPQLLQGDFELADRCLDELRLRIVKSKPKTVITACVECFEALLRIKAKHGEDFEVQTIAEYLLRHRDKFPAVKLREKATLHDSCRLARRYHRSGAARKIIAHFSELVESGRSGEETMCCYYWNMGHDPKNREHREERLEEAREKAPTMVCDCVSCYEKYQGQNSSVEVLELLELFELALENGGGGQ
jgi:Fe-S oxidoreductase